MKLSVYSQREQHNETLILDIEDEGWVLMHDYYRGLCSPTGKPHLFDCLEKLNAEYPPKLSEEIEKLWLEAKKDNLEDFEIQRRLYEIGRWVRLP